MKAIISKCTVIILLLASLCFCFLYASGEEATAGHRIILKPGMDNSGQRPDNKNTQKSPSSNFDYVKMLEDGKEWTYRMICHDALKYDGPIADAGIDQFRRTLKIEGTTEIDGVDYYNIYEYVTLLSGEESDALNSFFQLPKETPVLYMSEDPEKGIVSVKYDENEGIGGTWIMSGRMQPRNGMLYDIFNSTGIHGDATLGDVSVQSEHGILRGFSVTKDPAATGLLNFHNLLVVEGIGFIEGTPKSDKYGCDLLGEAVNITTSFPDGMHYPHLYTVKLADGTVLYKDPAYSTDTNSLSEISENAKVILGNGAIVVKSAGAVSLYDSKGCLVRRSWSDGESRIDVSGLPHGLYMLIAADRTFKIII